MVAGALVTIGISHVLSVLFAFMMHRRLVFRVRGHALRDLLRFESVYLTTFGINAVAFTALVELGLQRIPAQAIVFLPTLLPNYLGHRYFSFRRSATLIPTTAWRRRRLLRTGSRGRRIGHLAMRFA
jgi:putative flippase GtrA